MRDEVAVTGAEGFIGSHLVEALVRRGYRVRAMVLYNMLSSRGWLGELPADVLGQVDVVFGDVRDPASVRQVVEGADVVYHLAALGSVPYSYRAPRSFVDTNTIGTLQVLEAVRACGTPRMVHTSTSETYGTTRSVRWWSAPTPAQSPYAASKVAADKLARVLLPELGTPVVTLRPVRHLRPAPDRPAPSSRPSSSSSRPVSGAGVHFGAFDRPTSPMSRHPPRRSSTWRPASPSVGQLFDADRQMSRIGRLRRRYRPLIGVDTEWRDPAGSARRTPRCCACAVTPPGCVSAPGGSRASPVSRDSSRPSNGSSGQEIWPATTPTSTTSEQRRHYACGHPCRGQGRQAAPLHDETAQPFVPIGEEHSIMEIVLSQLAWSGFSRVTLAIGHLGELIRSYVGDGSRWGVQVDYGMPEEMPLGTMGPVLRVLDRLPEDFLVMNGDVLTDLDYADLMRRHTQEGSPLTVATFQRQQRIDYGVLTTRDGRVVEFAEKPTIDYRVSMGIYVCSKQALTGYTPGLPFGFDELVLDMLSRGTLPVEYAFDGYWFDIGRPDEYDRVNAEFGLIKGSLLKEA